MTAIILLLALSALIGFVLGTGFSWFAIAASSIGIAFLSSAILQVQGFSWLPGIAVVVACLTVNQMAYLAGAVRRPNGRDESLPAITSKKSKSPHLSSFDGPGCGFL
jgi:membrane peptidoglycan carboxypeptidase